MSDVRRVCVTEEPFAADRVHDDLNGTHYLVPREEYERWQRSRVKYAPGEENELFREQITEMQAEIERLREEKEVLRERIKEIRKRHGRWIDE